MIIDHYGISVSRLWLWSGVPLHHLSTVVDSIRQQEAKRIFVAKDPFYARVLPRLTRAFPDARHLILLRHPLKVAQSIEDSWGNDQGLRFWSLHYGEILKHMESLDCHVTKYEDLVLDSESTVRSICEYFEVTFIPDMLEYGGKRHTDDMLNLWGSNVAHSKASRTLKSVKTGRIDPDLAILNISKIDRKYRIQFENNAYYSRDIAEALGYELWK